MALLSSALERMFLGGVYFGMGRFGDADSATWFRRRGFGDGQFGDKIFRRCCFDDVVSAIDVSATGFIAGGRFGDRIF